MKKEYSDEVSQCPHCLCGTHTMSDGSCGKCTGAKEKIGGDSKDGIPPNDTKPNTSIESIVEEFSSFMFQLHLDTLRNDKKDVEKEINDWLRTTIKADRERMEKAKEEELEMLLLQDLPESVVFIIKGRIKALNNQDKI